MQPQYFYGANNRPILNPKMVQQQQQMAMLMAAPQASSQLQQQAISTATMASTRNYGYLPQQQQCQGQQSPPGTHSMYLQTMSPTQPQQKPYTNQLWGQSASQIIIPNQQQKQQCAAPIDSTPHEQLSPRANYISSKSNRCDKFYTSSKHRRNGAKDSATPQQSPQRRRAPPSRSPSYSSSLSPLSLSGNTEAPRATDEAGRRHRHPRHGDCARRPPHQEDIGDDRKGRRTDEQRQFRQEEKGGEVTGIEAAGRPTVDETAHHRSTRKKKDHRHRDRQNPEHRHRHRGGDREGHRADSEQRENNGGRRRRRRCPPGEDQRPPASSSETTTTTLLAPPCITPPPAPTAIFATVPSPPPVVDNAQTRTLPRPQSKDDNTNLRHHRRRGAHAKRDGASAGKQGSITLKEDARSGDSHHGGDGFSINRRKEEIDSRSDSSTSARSRTSERGGRRKGRVSEEHRSQRGRGRDRKTKKDRRSDSPSHSRTSRSRSGRAHSLSFSANPSHPIPPETEMRPSSGGFFGLFRAKQKEGKVVESTTSQQDHELANPILTTAQPKPLCRGVPAPELLLQEMPKAYGSSHATGQPLPHAHVAKDGSPKQRKGKGLFAGLFRSMPKVSATANIDQPERVARNRRCSTRSDSSGLSGSCESPSPGHKERSNRNGKCGNDRNPRRDKQSSHGAVTKKGEQITCPPARDGEEKPGSATTKKSGGFFSRLLFKKETVHPPSPTSLEDTVSSSSASIVARNRERDSPRHRSRGLTNSGRDPGASGQRSRARTSRRRSGERTRRPHHDSSGGVERRSHRHR